MTKDIRVLIVDDSAFARMAIARELKRTGGIEIIDVARNGLEALEKIKLLKPDVITLDVEMPQLDGLETIKRIMTECPTPAVMLSSLTGEGTESTLKALEFGAVDFFLKNTLANPIGNEGAADSLKAKIVLASNVKPLKPIVRLEAVKKLAAPIKKETPHTPAGLIVVIGSSTGGPKALYTVVPELPADITAAVLIVQHMPPGFTGSLANRLDQLSKIEVKEVEPGDVICQGMAYVARGGYHMVIDRSGTLALTETATVCGVRPSVNVTMESVVQHFGSAVLGVVLTGMGTDGTDGALHIKRGGGKVLVQDEATCVVYGMPKSIVDSGYADAILPISEIAGGITETLKSYPQGVNNERSRIQYSKR